MTTLPISQMSVSQLQAAFVAVQSRIVTHAHIYFRDIVCPQRRTDAIAEAVALCWKWFRNLAQRGKDPRRFVSVLAGYAVRAVRCGRRVCGQLKAHDVLNERGQHRYGFRIEALPLSTRTGHEELYGTVNGQRRIDTFEERLQDNTRTPVPEQAAFRCDFPAWLATRTERDRHIIEDMARNERTMDLARKSTSARPASRSCAATSTTTGSGSVRTLLSLPKRALRWLEIARVPRKGYGRRDYPAAGSVVSGSITVRCIPSSGKSRQLNRHAPVRSGPVWPAGPSKLKLSNGFACPARNEQCSLHALL